MRKFTEMKSELDQVIFGFDGLDDVVLSKLPNFKSLLEQRGCDSWNINEPFNGMWERGWTKIITGKSAEQSEAYYNRVTKSLLRSAAPGSNEWRANEKTLWNVNNIGLYGVPGTHPIPKGKLRF